VHSQKPREIALRSVPPHCGQAIVPSP
jgi:hypothetical protein